VYGGAIPPIPDDPKTPEDEYELNLHSFKPIVYREYYGNKEDGTESSYFVLSYVVSRLGQGDRR
jgi:hypothetical protein